MTPTDVNQLQVGTEVYLRVTVQSATREQDWFQVRYAARPFAGTIQVHAADIECVAPPRPVAPIAVDDMVTANGLNCVCRVVTLHRGVALLDAGPNIRLRPVSDLTRIEPQKD